jgi:adenylate cyclase
MQATPSIEAVLGNIVALVAAGMGVAFFAADWRSSTSRVLAAFLACMGLAIWTTSGFQSYRAPEALPLWVKLSGIPVTLSVIAGSEWLLRIRRTIPAAANLNTRPGDILLRCAQGAATIYGVLTLVFWRERAEWLIFRLGTVEGVLQPRFLIFAIPFFVAVALIGWVAVLTLNRKPDWPEKVRLIALVVALPFLASGFVVRPETAAYWTVIGLMIFLVGALEYHVAQGQRGQFMARFLAPQVADLVRRQGLEQTIRDQKCEISAVYCDIRGFTPYAEQQETEKVMGLLRKYYDAVGAAATEVGGTIKDYAGDGVLILIGAPLPYPDRAARALRLAETLVRGTRSVLEPAKGSDHDLGLGIGIASGPVSVGVVGGARLEYVAVGSTVNLAARLCQIARSGQILLDRHTRELLGDDRRLTEEARVTLKGFSEPVPVYAFA